MILRPQRNYTIVRQLANHLDSGTYYVRAVVRDSYTDVILATLDLDDKGGQRFTKSWLVAPDPSGLGRDISIVSSVYTDSGYTTKSENYGDEENGYLIEANNLVGRGGGGSGIDSYTLRKVLKEELEKFDIEELFKKYTKEQETVDYERIEGCMKHCEPTDLTPVLEAIKDKAITKPTDLEPVMKVLTKISKSIDSIEPTDIQPVIEAIHKNEIPKLTEVVISAFKALPDIVEKRFKSAIKDKIMAGRIVIEDVNKEKEEDEEKEPQLDFNKLTS